MSAIRIALGFLCTLCVASAAETGNISATTSIVAAAKQSDTKAVRQSSLVKRSSAKRVDLALTRHTSSFHGPLGPTLSVGARYVVTPSAGLSKSWLDNSGQISEGEQVYDWPPGARIVASAPAEIVPVAAPVASVAPVASFAPAKAALAPVKSVGR